MKGEPLGDVLTPELFRALGDGNRLTLLETLAKRGSASVGELGACCPVDLSVVSRHLSVLRAAGVLEATRRGKRVLYRARLRQLAKTLRSIADALERCCAPEASESEEGTSEPEEGVRV